MSRRLLAPGWVATTALSRSLLVGLVALGAGVGGSHAAASVTTSAPGSARA